MAKKHDAEVKSILDKSVTLARDYGSLLFYFKSKIEEWAPGWTDWGITDPGILFTNADAFSYDMCNYMLDQAYLNNILRFTRDPEILYFMSLFAGVELPSYKASTGEVQIVNNSNGAVTIPPDFPMLIKDKATNDEVWFYTTNKAPYMILKKFSGTLPIIEGKRTALNLRLSDFNQDQTVALTGNQIGENTFKVFIDFNNDGTFWDFDGEHYTATGPDNKIHVFSREPDKTIYTNIKKHTHIASQIQQVKDAFISTSEDIVFSVHPAYECIKVKLSPGLKRFLQVTQGRDDVSDTLIRIIYGTVKGAQGGNIGEVYAECPLEKTASTPWHELTYRILGTSGAQDPLSHSDNRITIGNETWRVKTLVREKDYDNLCGKGKEFPELVRLVYKQDKGSNDVHIWAVPKQRLSAMMGDDRSDILRRLKEYCVPYLIGGDVIYVDFTNDFSIVIQLQVKLKGNSSNTNDIEAQIKSITESYLDRTVQPKNFRFRRSELLGKIEAQIGEVEYAAMISPSTDLVAKDNEIIDLLSISVNFI